MCTGCTHTCNCMVRIERRAVLNLEPDKCLCTLEYMYTHIFDVYCSTYSSYRSCSLCVHVTPCTLNLRFHVQFRVKSCAIATWPTSAGSDTPGGPTRTMQAQPRQSVRTAVAKPGRTGRLEGIFKVGQTYMRSTRYTYL